MLSTGGRAKSNFLSMTKHLTGENSVEVRLELPHLARHTSAESKKQMPSISKWRFATCALLVALAFALPRASAGDAVLAEADAGALQPLVHADWELQEKRLGRSPQSPEAIRAALRRAALLLEDLRGTRQAWAIWPSRRPNSSGWPRELTRVLSLDEPSRIDLYRQIRTLDARVGVEEPAGDFPADLVHAAPPCRGVHALRVPGLVLRPRQQSG